MKSMLLTAALCTATFLSGMAQAATKTYPGHWEVPVTVATPNGTSNGTFVIKEFANINSVLNAVGTLTVPNFTDSSGNITTAVTSIAVPVVASNPTTTASAPAATCPILHLVLGPLNLNLLGLQVTLNQVVLDVTAIPGAGNLLGNLLCDIAGLLNPLNLGGLVQALNILLASL